MKRTTIQSLFAATLCAAASFASAKGLAVGSLFSRVDDQATKVTEAYAALYEGFYGGGRARTLLKAALDMRPDGTPNITLDRAAGEAQFTIRLSVDERAYNAWKADAHKRIEAVGMSVTFSDFEDAEARVIGGKFYRFGDNEEAALRRWEESDKPALKADLAVRVELVDANESAVMTSEIPIKSFRRPGFRSYPIPLHHLNRLRDLPLDRFQWGNIEGMRRSLTDALRKIAPDTRIEGDSVESIRRALEKAEANLDVSKRYKWGDVEDAYATLTLSGLTDEIMNSVVDVRCTVFDDEKAGRAAASIVAGMVQIPGTGYKMGKFEITQAQWEAVMGENPSRFEGADNPVECVSWYDCQEFLKKINRLPEVKNSGLTLRLPTAVEWVYACRAGATGDYSRLVDESEITASTLDRVAWFDDNSEGMTHPVGQKRPNAFGLYDMHGNVEEWTQTEGGDFREGHVPCGGNWGKSADRCRSSSGGWATDDWRDDNLGFRLCAERRVTEEEQRVATEKAVPESTSDPVRIDAPPRLVNPIRPVYPAGARQRKEEGAVVLELAVSAEGVVTAASVAVSCGYPELDDAALSAAKEARFVPAKSGDSSVAATGRITIKFQLDDAANL